MHTLRLGADGEDGTSLAVSDDGQRWAVVNATADLGRHLRERPGLRASLGAVVLLDARIEHVAGLLSLRDGPALEVWATPNVFEDLTSGLPLLTVLQHYCGVRWHVIPVAGMQRHAEIAIASLPGLAVTAEATDEAPAPPYSAHARDEVGNRIALLVEDRRDGERLVVDGTSALRAGLETAS